MSGLASPVLYRHRRILWWVVMIGVAVPAVVRGVLYMSLNGQNIGPAYATVAATHVPMWVYGIVWAGFGLVIAVMLLGWHHDRLPLALGVFTAALFGWAAMFLVSAVDPPTPPHVSHSANGTALPHRGADLAIAFSQYALFTVLLSYATTESMLTPGPVDPPRVRR